MLLFTTSLRFLGVLIITFLSFTVTPFAYLLKKEKTKILIISSPFDHPYGSHMYEHEGKLLAKCLEQTPGVQAITSYGWPTDPEMLKGVKSLVFYSKSAYDLIMADSVTRRQAMALMDNKVGFACIHMSTLTTANEMVDLLGARWYFKMLPDGLNLDVRPARIIKMDNKHPISRGWDNFVMRDEIYMSTILHKKAHPVIKAEARAGDEVVAWTFQRKNGGRSFGTTLGHFHKTFRNKAFRRILVNSILWTAGIKIPKKGAPVDITPAEDVLPPNPRVQAIARAEPLDQSRFEKEVLVANCNDPMQLAVRPDGSVYFIEKNGNLRFYNANNRQVSTLGTVPVYKHAEVGMLGLALDNDFDKSKAVYMFFCPAAKNTVMRLSVFKLKDDMLDLGSEKILIEYNADTNNGHQGGGLYMATDGTLLIGTGDNTSEQFMLNVDERKGRTLFDSQRTSANTNSLRGKILRILPRIDGTYTIPPGNLFNATARTRPEIYAMGVRNGFRMVEDPMTGCIYWGDIGQNVSQRLGVGPNGYDEINCACQAGNFGWPMFTGPNEAYRKWDFANNNAGDMFDINRPKNTSPNNTGLIDLPKPQGAFIWYPTTVSKNFPMLGSGGRSAMVGPVYRWAEVMFACTVCMPAQYDNSLFIYDWMRNWIKVVKLDWNGNITEILPFMPQQTWHKPIDIKLGADNSLYVAEMGDAWFDNKNSQISRIIYRRGNRPPVAVLTTMPEGGKQPLRVSLNASASYDKDTADRVSYSWRITGPAMEAIPVENKASAQTMTSFTKPGNYLVKVIVTDSHGAADTAQTTISVGNAPPKVTLLRPLHGSFYDWGQPVAFKVMVSDAEDANINPKKVLLQSAVLSRWVRNIAPDKLEEVPAGLQLMRTGTCFSCHQTNDRSIGPAYTAVAQKYKARPAMRDQLAQKIIDGGRGEWGEVVMPPHPQYTLPETRQMVDWILALTDTSFNHTVKGLQGTLPAPAQTPLAARNKYSNVMTVTATYTDKGAAGLPAVTRTAMGILHSRVQRAANFSQGHKVDIVEVFEAGEGRCAQFKPGGYIVFEDVNLQDVSVIRLNAEVQANSNLNLEIRAGAPNGKLLGKAEIAGGKTGFNQIEMPVNNPGGLHDLYLVMKDENNSGGLLTLSWIDFMK